MPSDKTAPKLGLLVIVTICLLFVMGFPLLGRAISAAGATSIFCDTITQVSKPECDALVGLYNATAGTSWTGQYRLADYHLPLLLVRCNL